MDIKYDSERQVLQVGDYELKVPTPASEEDWVELWRSLPNRYITKKEFLSRVDELFQPQPEPELDVDVIQRSGVRLQHVDSGVILTYIQSPELQIHWDKSKPTSELRRWAREIHVDEQGLIDWVVRELNRKAL